MLDVNAEITYLRRIPVFGDFLSRALQLIQSGVNDLGTNLGGDPTQTVPAPPQIQQLNVKTDGSGTVHVAIEDKNPIQKNLHYFVEYHTSPDFKQPQVAHLGVSRTIPPFILPSLDDNGKAQQWYFRAYSQYPGGHPSKPVLFGGTTATAVNPGGGKQLTLLSSTGSGTAPADGQSGGSGFGKVLFRGPFKAEKA